MMRPKISSNQRRRLSGHWWYADGDWQPFFVVAVEQGVMLLMFPGQHGESYLATPPTTQGRLLYPSEPPQGYNEKGERIAW